MSKRSLVLSLIAFICVWPQAGYGGQAAALSSAFRDSITAREILAGKRPPLSSGTVSSSSLPEPQSAPNIGVNGKLSTDKVKRGGIVRGSVTMDIPSGFHVNSNRPLEKFLVATQLTIEPSNGVHVGPIAYPRALLRNFEFSKTRVSVYEGRAVMSFSVIVPPKASTGSVQLKGKLRYQSCSNSLCFPPRTQEVSLWLTVN